MKPTAGLRPTDDQQLLIRKMLTNLLGKIDFDRLCLGIEVGGINKDVLQIFVQEHCAVEIKLHYSDDFAAAAEYALGAPVRMVKVVPVDIAVAVIERPSIAMLVDLVKPVGTTGDLGGAGRAAGLKNVLMHKGAHQRH